MAWHFREGQDWSNCEAIKSLRKRPVVVNAWGQMAALHHDDSGCIESPLPMADPEAFLVAVRLRQEEGT